MGQRNYGTNSSGLLDVVVAARTDPSIRWAPPADGYAPARRSGSGCPSLSYFARSIRHHSDEWIDRRCDRHTSKETNMTPSIRSLVIPVSDLDAAKALYTTLLGAPHTDQPYYVGYNVDGFEVSLAPGDVAGGPVAFADVQDLDVTRATLLAAGATERSAPRQVAPEARVCVLADADGNPIGLRGR
jgi:catechol 2,3-dioxygenase-like lactoylglutathione lyase family enzyme